MFSKQFVLYHKEGMKCWPGWYFICSDNNYWRQINISFIDLEIFSIQWIKSGVEVPKKQVPCKTIRISSLQCTLHTRVLKMLRVFYLLKLASYPGESIHFTKRIFFFFEEFRYATYFLLDNKLKLENAEILTFLR